MRSKEHELQKGCVKWFRLQYPRYIIYAIPNGGQRNISVARKLKAEGVLSGVPDLHIPVPNRAYHSLYIEMKTGYNKPTENQKKVMEELSRFGNKCVVCKNFDEFQKEVSDYLNE